MNNFVAQLQALYCSNGGPQMLARLSEARLLDLCEKNLPILIEPLNLEDLFVEVAR